MARIPPIGLIYNDDNEPIRITTYSSGVDYIDTIYGGTGRPDISGLFSSIDNVPVTYNEATKQFVVGTVEAEAVVGFDNIRDAFASGTGTLGFGGDIVVSGGGKFRGNFSGNLEGTADSAIFSIEANVIRDVKFNGIELDISGGADIIVSASEIAFSAIQKAFYEANGNINYSGLIVLSGGGAVSGNLSGLASRASLAGSSTSALSATNATRIPRVRFNGTYYDLETDTTDVTIAGGGAIEYSSVSAVLASGTGPLSFNNNTLSGISTLSANNVTGTNIRGTISVSSPSVSGEVGRFTTSLSSASVTGISLVGTTGNITTLNATSLSGTNISGTTGRFTTDLSSASVSGEVGRFTTSLSSNSVTATNFTATNNVTVNGSIAATGNIITTGTVSGADGRFTTSVSSAAVSGNTARFNTDVSSASITGTTLAGTTGNITTVNATNVTGVSITATNFTATNNVTVNGSIAATGTISTTTGTVTAADIRGTTSVSSASVSGTNIRGTVSVSSASVSGTEVVGATGRFTSNVSAVSVSGETAYFTTISATNYQGYPTGGGDSNATSIQGIPAPTATSTDHNKVLTYLSGTGEYVLTSKIGQAIAEGTPGSLVGGSEDTQFAVATSGGGSFIVSGMPDGTFLVASGGSVVPAYLPSYMLRYFGTNGTGSWGSPISNPAEVLNAEGQFLYYDATNQRYTNTGNLKVVGNNNLTATNVSATTVSATNYRNIRPYVSAVDSSTTTSVNISGDYDTYLVNTTTTSVTLYLPDASAWTSKQITVSKIDDGGSYRSVTLSGTTLQTATNTVRLYDPTESVTVISNGTNWYSLDYDRAYGVVVVAKNSTGSTLTKGTPVKVTGATGDNVLIGAVSAANNHVPQATDGNLTRCIGVVEHDIPNGEFGHVLTKGTLYKFNTNAYNEGDVLYLASGGGFTNVKPPAPYDEVFLGIVTRKQSVNGSILIDIANPIHINDIVGFNLASSLVNGDLISYDTTTSTFKNVQAVNVSGQGKFGSVSATNLSATNITATTYTGLPTSFDATSIVGLTVNPALGIGNPGDIFYWDGDINQFSMIGSGVLLAGAYVTSATSALNAQQAPNGLNVTGSVQITSDLTVSGKISSQKYPTYIYTATGISVAANKLMFDMFNGTGSGKTLKVTRIVAYVRNTTTITGINQVLECYRTSSVGTGGTTITESKMVTTDPNLNANITARNTPTNGAAYYIPSGVLAAANIYTEEGQNLQERVFLYVYDSFAGLEECLTLREGEGLRIITGAQGAAGVIAIYAYFITV
jgi:hypothetical protein